MASVEVQIPPRVVKALGQYARAEGLSLSEAARYALCCGPTVCGFLDRQGVPSADVVGP
jgi:hypothetical protein